MELALNLGYHSGPGDPSDHLRLALAAERAGFSSVWAAEAYGSDAATPLAWLAAHTEHIGLGSAVMQIPARTPAMTAMTAATLDLLSAGRFRLGLGVSGPHVSEGWHGVAFAEPLARTREYVTVVRQALRRETVHNTGKFYPLPLPDSKPLRMMLHPRRSDLPVYLGAVGPRNLALAGEIADGWLPAFFMPESAGDSLAHVLAGRRRRGLDLTGFDVAPTVPVVIGEDVTACAAAVRGYTALYLGGMGDFYARQAERMGYGEQAQRIRELFLAGRKLEAAAAVPLEFLDATALLGPPARIATRLGAYADAGVTTLAVCLFGRDTDRKVRTLENLAEIAASVGLGTLRAGTGR